MLKHHLILGFFFIILVGCATGTAKKSAAIGTHGGACLAGDICNEGLECSLDLCWFPTELGGLDEPCRPGLTCDGDLICAADRYCRDEADPCIGVTCSDHGACALLEGEPICICDTDYHADGLECVEDGTDLCAGVECSGHGTCVTVDGNPSCDCDTDYHPVDLECIEDSPIDESYILYSGAYWINQTRYNSGGPIWSYGSQVHQIKFLAPPEFGWNTFMIFFPDVSNNENAPDLKWSLQIDFQPAITDLYPENEYVCITGFSVDGGDGGNIVLKTGNQIALTPYQGDFSVNVVVGNDQLNPTAAPLAAIRIPVSSASAYLFLNMHLKAFRPNEDPEFPIQYPGFSTMISIDPNCAFYGNPSFISIDL